MKIFTGRERLAELLGLLVIRDLEGVKVLAATKLELSLVGVLLDADLYLKKMNNNKTYVMEKIYVPLASFLLE